MTPEDETPTCTWTEDTSGDGAFWETACGKAYCFEEGTPQENDVRFCQWCGNGVTFVPYQETFEDE